MMSMEEFPFLAGQQIRQSFQTSFHTMCLVKSCYTDALWGTHTTVTLWVRTACKIMVLLENLICCWFRTRLCILKSHNTSSSKNFSHFFIFKGFFSIEFFILNEHSIFSYFLPINDLPLVCQSVLLSSKTISSKMSALDLQLNSVVLNKEFSINTARIQH